LGIYLPHQAAGQAGRGAVIDDGDLHRRRRSRVGEHRTQRHQQLLVGLERRQHDGEARCFAARPRRHVGRYIGGGASEDAEHGRTVGVGWSAVDTSLGRCEASPLSVSVPTDGPEIPWLA
ncbi:MAG: hypothetical protein ACK56I_35415, partial [bacterium]